MRYPSRPCANCSKPFNPIRLDGIFCSRSCLDGAKREAHLRAMALYRDLYWWRLTQYKDGKDRLAGMGLEASELSGSPFSAMSRTIDGWLKADQAKGKAPPPLPEHLETKRLNASYEARMKELQKV